MSGGGYSSVQQLGDDTMFDKSMNDVSVENDKSEMFSDDADAGSPAGSPSNYPAGRSSVANTSHVSLDIRTPPSQGMQFSIELVMDSWCISCCCIVSKFCSPVSFS